MGLGETLLHRWQPVLVRGQSCACALKFAGVVFGASLETLCKLLGFLQEAHLVFDGCHVGVDL